MSLLGIWINKFIKAIGLNQIAKLPSNLKCIGHSGQFSISMQILQKGLPQNTIGIVPFLGSFMEEMDDQLQHFKLQYEQK